MGRLAPGVEVAQAEAELTTLYQQAQAAEPQPPAAARQPTPADYTMHLAPGAQGFDLLFLGSALGATTSEVDSILRLVRSQLELSLRQLG